MTMTKQRLADMRERAEIAQAVPPSEGDPPTLADALSRDVLALLAKLDALEQRLAEVRRRAVADFYSGTSPSAAHWAACRMCSWTWTFGEAELHEPTCPLAQVTP